MCGHRRCDLSGLGQRRVSGAEVVNTTEQKHRGLDGVRGARQGTSATGETTEALAEGRVQVFDVSGVDEIDRQQQRTLQGDAANLTGQAGQDACPGARSPPRPLLGLDANLITLHR